MTWRLESNGASGSNRVLIEPVSDELHEGKLVGKFVTIKVTSRNGEKPTLPFLQPGQIYTSRDKMEYTIVDAGLEEIGPDSGEKSTWSYVYLAAFGVHRFTEHSA